MSIDSSIVLMTPPHVADCEFGRAVPVHIAIYTADTVISVNLYTDADLTIGALARRTGVSVSTIRAWERRFGFPVPARLESGHRRYTEGDVEAILAALRERHAGSSIGVGLGASEDDAPRATVVAVRRLASRLARRGTGGDVEARDVDAQPGDRGRDRRPRRRSDSDRSVPARAVLARLRSALGETWRRRPRPRSCWPRSVVGDVETTCGRYQSTRRRRSRASGLVVCDSAAFSACLAAVELPDAADRMFEVLWTTEPIAVRDVARIAAEIAIANEPTLDEILKAALQAPAVTRYDSVRATTAVTNRVVAYMDRRH